MATLYPTLTERYEAPGYLVPAFYIWFALAALTPSRSVRCSLLVLLVAQSVSSPAFKGKDLNEDYGRGLPSFTIPIFLVDLLILSHSNKTRFVGAEQEHQSSDAGISDEDCNTLWEKFKWGFRLVTTFRGIGWNFQVKGVPLHSDKKLTRRDFAIKYLALSVRSWIYKSILQYVLGFARGAQAETSSCPIHNGFEILEGYAGAFWGCVGLMQFYQLGAAVSVGIGLCEPWEWPPFFGSIENAWSVRQMWR